MKEDFSMQRGGVKEHIEERREGHRRKGKTTEELKRSVRGTKGVHTLKVLPTSRRERKAKSGSKSGEEKR